MKRNLIRIKSSGFTLIEILIVLLIISIVAGVALLTMNRNQNRELESFANELAQMLTLAEEQAMLQPAVLGLIFNDRQFQFVQYEPADADKKSKWKPLADTALRLQAIPHDIELAIKTVGEHGTKSDNKTLPQIIISTNGDITPFTLYIGKKGEKPRYVIKGDADGNVSKQLFF